MIRDLLLGFGFVAVVEGLVLALAPGRLKHIAQMMQDLSLDRMRALGLVILGFGVVLLWASKTVGA